MPELTMDIRIIRSDISAISTLREQFLFESHCQSRFHATHGRGRSDTYLIHAGGHSIGYGSVKGLEEPTDRDTIFEFHILPPFRDFAAVSFRELIRASEAPFIECQSNHLLLAHQFYQFATDISTTTILFGDLLSTDLQHAGGRVRPRTESDVIFEHRAEPVGDFVLDAGGTIVATGGFLTHYNAPFADLFMEVHPDHRGKGHGSFLVQELKKQCYLSGRVPAARCDLDNAASRATLLKAGMSIAGHIRRGTILHN